MFVVWVLLSILLAVVSYYFLGKSRDVKYRSFYETPTSPLWLPIIGHSLEFMFNKGLLAKVEYAFGKYSADHTSVLAYIPFRTYITAVPEECKIILNEVIDKSKFYDYLKLMFGDTLLLAPAEQWKTTRKLYSRSFKQNILDCFVTTFNEKCDILVDKLRSQKYKDLWQLFENYTLDIFCEATIGIKTSILADDDNTFAHSLIKLQSLLADRIGNVKQMSDRIFPLLPEGREATKRNKNLIAWIQNIINRKRTNDPEDQGLNVSHLGLPVLDLLLEIQPKNNLTDAYIIKEMVLFAGAATETSALTTAFTSLMLALHPEIQEKVYQEVKGFGYIEPIDINSLRYTEMVINETMRLLPATPLIGRRTTKDVDIGGKVIPKDTDIVLNIHHMHRNKTIYPDPLKFDPERFSPEEVKKRHPYSYLAFSGGPRNCIGFKYAQMVLKITIAKIVKNFVIVTSHKSLDDVEFESAIIMKPKRPMDIRFIPRQ